MQNESAVFSVFQLFITKGFFVLRKYIETWPFHWQWREHRMTHIDTDLRCLLRWILFLVLTCLGFLHYQWVYRKSSKVCFYFMAFVKSLEEITLFSNSEQYLWTVYGLKPYIMDKLNSYSFTISPLSIIPSMPSLWPFKFQ